MVLLNRNDSLISKWSGGTTAQLLIFPEFSQYKDRDFDYRISVATIDDETSVFTSLAQYKRYLVALSEKVNLVNGENEISLNRCEAYEFDGSDHVVSKGKAMDFGVMCRKGICHAEIEIRAYEMGEKIPEIGDYAYCAIGFAERLGDNFTVQSAKAVVIFVSIIYDLKLVMPSQEHRAIWDEAMEEFEKYEEQPMPYGIWEGKKEFSEFYSATVYGRNLKERQYCEELGFVISPSTTMFLMGQNEDKILGAISLRHLLTEELRKRGGNIGYGIMPSARKRGYGKLMLKMFLEQCRDFGIACVILTCDSENAASKHTIIKNGGILYSTDITEDGIRFERYYILLLK